MWPIAHLLAVSSPAKGSTAVERPRVVSRESATSWGPLSLEGLDKMHRGDLFYAALAIAAYALTWPSDAELAAPWDGALPPRWVWLVLSRNALLELSVYELFHQVYFGCLATDAIRARFGEDAIRKGRALR